MNLSLISERIRQQRKEKGLTQADLAELLGMSEMTIRRWEAGKSSPRIDELQKVASMLETSVEYLIGIDERQNIELIRPKTRAEEKKSLSMGYWGNVLDNARIAVKDGQDLGLIYSMLADAAGTVKSAMA